MRNIQASDDPASIYWRLEEAYKKDPLIQMLSENVRNGIARAFFDGFENGISRWFNAVNAEVRVREILKRAPLGWVGDEFKKHVAAVTVAALFPECENEEEGR